MSGSRIRLYGSTSGYVELEAPAVAPDGVLTLPATTGAFGGLVAVKSAILDAPFSASLAAGADTAVTSLNVTHALADASNKLLLTYTVTAAGGETNSQVSFAINDGTSLINVGSAGGASQPRVTTATEYGLSSRGKTVHAATFVYAPGDTASRTYTLHVVNSRGVTQTVYVNRENSTGTDANFPRPASSLVIQEVSV